MGFYRKSATVLAVAITSTLTDALTDLDALARLEGFTLEPGAIDITGDLTYNKWGGSQTAKVGDFLLYNSAANGDVYTCDKTVMETTYEEVGENEYIKTATIEAYEALDTGEVSTLEGKSAYKPGDFIVTNPGGDKYVISAETFQNMYEQVT